MNGGIDLKKRFESFILFRRPFVSLVRRHKVTSPSPLAPALGCATEPPKSLNGKRGCALPKSFASYALLSSRHLFPPRLTLAGVRLPRVSREGFRLRDSFLRLQPSSTSRRAIAAVGFHTGFPSGRLTSSNVAT